MGQKIAEYKNFLCLNLAVPESPIIHYSSKSQIVLPHYEDTPAFQQEFTSDVIRVFKNFSCNPFEQEDLAKASNVNITYLECVHKALKTQFSESQFRDFWNCRLIKWKITIDHKITKNVLSIPGRYEKNQKESEKRLIYPITVLTKLRSSIDFWSTLSKELFKTELFGVSQLLAQTLIDLYHSKRSDVLSVFTRCDMLLRGPSAAIIIELSPLVEKNYLTDCRTFLDLALALYSRISNIAAGHIQVDVITDRYVNSSLKEGTQGEIRVEISTIMKRYTNISRKILSETAWTKTHCTII